MERCYPVRWLGCHFAHLKAVETRPKQAGDFKHDLGKPGQRFRRAFACMEASWTLSFLS